MATGDYANSGTLGASGASGNPHINFADVASDTGDGAVGSVNRFNRFFGLDVGQADPIISGFGMVFFVSLPAAVENSGNYLTAVTHSMDLPDITIDAVTYDGRDGGQWHVPGAIKMNGDLTLTMWELTGAPTYRTIARWIHLMRNPIFGFMTETTWKHANYKGRLLYAYCNPDLSVQWTKMYSGIWPTNLNDSVLKMNDNQDKVEYSVTFKFDHYPYTSTSITAQAQSLVASAIGDSSTGLMSTIENSFPVQY